MQVYLQAAGETDSQSWNAKFSNMMVKVLQDTYNASQLRKQNLARSDVMVDQAATRSPPPQVPATDRCFS